MGKSFKVVIELVLDDSCGLEEAYEFVEDMVNDTRCMDKVEQCACDNVIPKYVELS